MRWTQKKQNVQNDYFTTNSSTNWFNSHVSECATHPTSSIFILKNTFDSCISCESLTTYAQSLTKIWNEKIKSTTVWSHAKNWEHTSTQTRYVLLKFIQHCKDWQWIWDDFIWRQLGIGSKRENDGYENCHMRVRERCNNFQSFLVISSQSFLYGLSVLRYP